MGNTCSGSSGKNVVVTGKSDIGEIQFPHGATSKANANVPTPSSDVGSSPKRIIPSISSVAFHVVRGFQGFARLLVLRRWYRIHNLQCLLVPTMIMPTELKKWTMSQVIINGTLTSLLHTHVTNSCRRLSGA